jgi:2-polyprenyl-3-methyl-5-hydroxy-6-metoxy-1,4-benzoquinol methylase
MDQREHQQELNTTQKNQTAWSKGSYDAWVSRLGEPSAAIERIKQNPAKTLGPLADRFGDVQDKTIMNLLGSHGSKAVALALLGARVSVVDYSPGNQRYALELAAEAGVTLDYILSDVRQLPADRLAGQYDVVFAEMGILHYFTALEPLMSIIYRLLHARGRLILRDFHPVSTKLISSRGTTAKIRKHKVTGDYFDTSLVEEEISYQKFLPPGGERLTVQLRKWTLGEIVTAVADSGLIIKQLVEEPNLSSDVIDKGIPKTFTLVAEK